MAPRSSWPTMWKEFLPISMPTTAIGALSVWDMARSLSLVPRASIAYWWGGSTAGPSHYRTSSTRFHPVQGSTKEPRHRVQRPPCPPVDGDSSRLLLYGDRHFVASAIPCRVIFPAV